MEGESMGGRRIDPKFSQRVRELMGDNTQADIMRYANITSGTMQRILHKGHIPREEQTLKLAKFFKVSHGWLVTGLGAKNAEDQFLIPIAKIAIAEKETIVQLDENGTHVSYPTSGFKARSLNPESLIAVVMPGQAMEPVLLNGDLLLCDRNSGLSDGIFMLRLEGQLLVRQMQLFSGKLTLKAANPAFSDIQVEMSDDVDFEPIGRIVGRQQWL